MAIAQLTVANFAEALADPGRVVFMNGAPFYEVRFAGAWLVLRADSVSNPGVIIPDIGNEYPGIGLKDADIQVLRVRVMKRKDGTYQPVVGNVNDFADQEGQPYFEHWCPCFDVVAPAAEAVFNKV